MSALFAELDDALRPYKLSHSDLPRPLLAAIQQREAFTIAEGLAPKDIWRGRIQAEDLIQGTLLHEQASIGDRTFRLAAGGIAAASRLSPANPELQLKLERDLATAVNKLISHPVFAEWLEDHTRPTKFSAAGQFWGVAPGTPARVVRDRIANIEATLNEALHYMETRGVTQLFREKDRVLCERRDIERCIECHNALKERFSKELAILLS